MAIKVKSVAESAEKWGTRARSAAGEYAKEAEAAAETWAVNTMAASDNFKLAITAAGIDTRFRRGVQRAGSAKFARKVRELGSSRYPSGIDSGKPDYANNVEPYLSAIAALTQPARKPRGDPANEARVTQITRTLNAKRLALLATGS